MKRRTALGRLASVGGGAAASVSAVSGWKDAFAEKLRDDFLRHWISTRDYSLMVLDAMPEEHYGFKPTPEQRTFAEQSVHLARANNAYFDRFDKQTETPRPEQPEVLTKASVRQYVAGSFQYVRETLNSLDETDFKRRDYPLRAPHTAQDLFLRAYMHTAHHRGQIVVYLRLKGIEPPAWKFAPQG